jgi:hypothetical protein
VGDIQEGDTKKGGERGICMRERGEIVGWRGRERERRRR